MWPSAVLQAAEKEEAEPRRNTQEIDYDADAEGKTMMKSEA